MFSSEKEIATQYSQIFNQPLEFSNISISTSIQYSENQFRNSISSVWWPSPNLFLSAGISPNKSNNDINLYYQSSIGYTPEWTFSEKLNSTISMGMHRYRFSDIGNYRWYHFAILESANLYEFEWNLNWIYLFDSNWKHHQFQCEVAKTIKDIYRIHFGINTQLVDKIVITPSLKISLVL